MEREKTTFEKKIKPVLGYVGTIGAVVMSIVYIIAVIVLINGFSAEKNLTKTITFAVVNVIVGFCIMQFLKVQGESFAKDIPENKEIISKYIVSKEHKKHNHSMKYYWCTSVVKDIFSKCISLGITTFGVIFIVIEGNNDFSLLGLAIVNLLTFISFGILALVKTYDFYNNNYIPFVLEKLEERENGQQ